MFYLQERVLSILIDKIVFWCIVFVKIADIARKIILLFNGVWFVSYYQVF